MCHILDNAANGITTFPLISPPRRSE